MLHQEVVKLRHEGGNAVAELNRMHRENLLLREEITGLRGDLRELRDAFLLAVNTKHGLTEEQQVVLQEVAAGIASLPQVQATGHRREVDGTLVVCVLLNTRELDPEREVIAKWVDIEYAHANTSIDFSTRLSPPGTIDQLTAEGFKLLGRGSE